jgi:hypothetical protein
MGSSSRGNSTFIIPNIHNYRDRWKNRKPSDRLEEKLAFTLGWITHRSTDRYFKPRYGKYDKNPENHKPTDVRIFHDAIVYEKVYNSGTEEPFSKGYMETGMDAHPASEALNVTKAETLFGHLYQSELIELQSVKNSDDGESFMQRLLDQYAEFTVDFNRLIKAHTNPYPDKMKRFIEDPNFYQDSDPIIQLARSLQHDLTTPDINLSDALETKDQSQYAEVLSKTYKWIREASRYFMREIDVDLEYMYDFFNIYEDHRTLK